MIIKLTIFSEIIHHIMISKIHPRMHPIALLHKIFSEEHTLESTSNKIEQCYTHVTTKQGCITIPPHYLKIIPHV